MTNPSETKRLKLPYLAAGQAQKHVTYNEAMTNLDALLHLAVQDIQVSAPPANPPEGYRCIVASTNPVGAFAGHTNAIAEWSEQQWTFRIPQAGWLAVAIASRSIKVFDSLNWIDLNLQNVQLAGINAEASTLARLVVSSESSVFSHEGGAHRLFVNKATDSDTASIVFQRGYSGRAEIGLLGDAKLGIKISADGSIWKSAIAVDPTNGRVGIGLLAPLAAVDVAADEGSPVATFRSGAHAMSFSSSGASSGFMNVGGHLKVGTASGHDLVLTSGNTERMRIEAGGNATFSLNDSTRQFRLGGSLRVGQFAKAGLPSAAISGAGAVLYVSDDVGGAVLAFSDGAVWRRVTDRAIIS